MREQAIEGLLAGISDMERIAVKAAVAGDPGALRCAATAERMRADLYKLTKMPGYH